MNVPPNIKPLNIVLEISNFGRRENLYSLLVCPVCGGENNQIGQPRTVKGSDSYEAWDGRGDLMAIPFDGECGSEWEMCFGFHKGSTNAFVRIRKSCTEKSYLYFIEAINTGYIKIGRSANPDRRLAQLTTGSPNQLVLLGKISGGSALEAELHRRFEGHREKGEWFKASSELKEFIKQATA
jgi:hypothetical protein